MRAETIATWIAVALSPVLVYLGNRYMARQSREAAQSTNDVEQRKVDQEAFDSFVKRYEEERMRLTQKLDRTNVWLFAAFAYIGELRRDMVAAGMTPPAIPDTLRDMSLFVMTEQPPPKQGE